MTRMWMVDPKLLCRPHLLGEHREIHMIAGSVNKGRRSLNLLKSMQRMGIIEIQNLHSRHDELVEEMNKRGFKHNSPLPTIRYLWRLRGSVSREVSLQTLRGRCIACKELQAGNEEPNLSRTERQIGGLPRFVRMQISDNLLTGRHNRTE